LVVKTGVALPDTVYRQLVEIASRMGYSSVSKAIRDAVEMFIAFNRWWVHGGPVSGALLVLCSSRSQAAAQQVGELIRRYSDVVTAELIVNPSEEFMLRILVVSGDGSRVKSLYKELVRLRGVVSVQASLVPVPSPSSPPAPA